jgi:hypothetical protein
MKDFWGFINKSPKKKPPINKYRGKTLGISFLPKELRRTK